MDSPQPVICLGLVLGRRCAAPFFLFSGGRDGLDNYRNDSGGGVDHIRKLAHAFLAVVMFLGFFFSGGGKAFAAGPGPTVPVMCYSTTCVQTIVELCTAATQITPRAGRSYKANAQGRNTCDSIDDTDGHVQVSDAITPSQALWCGVSTKNPASYSVQAPAADGTCPVPSCGGSVTPDIVGPGGSFSTASGVIVGGSFCDSGSCAASGKPAGNSCVTVGGVTGCQTFFTGAVETGASCTQSPNGSDGPTPQCGPGLVMGTVNGVQTCLAAGATPAPAVSSSGKSTSAPVTTSSPNADGSVTNTTVTITTVNNADGSVTVTTDTSKSTTPSGGGAAIPGGTSSSSTTTGGTTKPPLTPDPAKDICTLHPELNMCKNSSVAGLCAATTCTGDAIQCAQLQQERTSYCDATNLTGTDATLGAAIASGADPMAALLPSSANAASVDLTAAGAGFDQTGFLGGGGSCLPDFQYSVMGGSGSFSFARICDSLAGLRLAVMVLASMFAYRMVSGAVLSEV